MGQALAATVSQLIGSSEARLTFAHLFEYRSPTVKKLILAAALVSGSGFAQTTVVVVPPADPYADAIIQLEMMQALTPTPARVTIAVATVWIKCGYVQSFTIQYTNGAVFKSTGGPDAKPFDRGQLAALVSTGKVAVIDEDALFGAQCP
jgi:hypothetical protein